MSVELEEKPTATAAREPRAVSVRLSTVAVAGVIAALVVTAGVFGTLWLSARADADAMHSADADRTRAEQVATDYALGASNINFQDINAWLGKLKANTTPELSNKFDATAPKLEQILVPLKWTSTSAPITAKVESETAGVYNVNVFVNVTSKNAQTPDGGQTTVTYSVTVDRNADWKIADVGGLPGALPLK